MFPSWWATSCGASDLEKMHSWGKVLKLPEEAFSPHRTADLDVGVTEGFPWNFPVRFISVNRVCYVSRRADTPESVLEMAIRFQVANFYLLVEECPPKESNRASSLPFRPWARCRDFNA